jgi:cytochrome c biogenesis protein
MVYGVHLSVLVVLLGALLGSIVGFKGFINLDEGETSSEVILTSGENSVQLPFQIRCDKFDVSFYDTGAPKEFRSDVTIIDGGKEVAKEPIIVNDPLTYKGITFYQASYGTTLRQAEIELKDSESGKSVTMTLPLHQAVLVPGTTDTIEITRYEQNLMRRLGQALVVMIAKEGQQSPQGSWVLADRPDFHGNHIQNYQIKVLRTDKAYYTGLQVKKDPGIWFVWIGFSLMVIGIGLTFYSSHTKIWVCVESNKKDTGVIVTVAGRSSRNAPGFTERFDELCRNLEDALKPGKNTKG